MEAGIVMVLYLLWVQVILTCHPSKRYVLRVFIHHIQLLGALAYVRLELSMSMQVFLRIMLSLATVHSATFPTQCFLNTPSSLVITLLLSQFVLILLALLLLLIRYLFHKTLLRSKEEIRLIAHSFLWQLSLGILLTVLPLFSSQSLPGAGNWLALDLSQAFWTAYNLSWVFYTGLVLLLLSLLCLVMDVKLNSPRGLLRKLCEGGYLIVKMVTVSAVILQMGYSPVSQLVLALCGFYSLLVLSALSHRLILPAELLLSAISHFLLTATFSLFFTLTHTNSRIAMGLISTLVILPNSLLLLLLLVFSLKSKRESPAKVRSLDPPIVPFPSFISADMISLSLAE